MRKNERRALLVIAGLAAIPLAQVEAGGRKEDPIRLAQDLFIERRVNEAILVLEEAVRDDPDQALEAEALLRKIRAIRVEYNDVLAQLLDTLENDPGDFVGALALIDRLVALDPFPNERLAREIESYRRVAQLAFDRNAVAEALDQADALGGARCPAPAVRRTRLRQHLRRERRGAVRGLWGCRTTLSGRVRRLPNRHRGRGRRGAATGLVGAVDRSVHLGVSGRPRTVGGARLGRDQRRRDR